MRGSVEFQDEQFELDLPDETLVGLWNGPAGVSGEAAVAAVRDALEQPLDFPPVRQAVVPGDRVAIALDSSLGVVGPLLSVLVDLLCQSGVEPGDVTVVASAGNRASLPDQLPRSIALELHDPTDQRRLAYLATSPDVEGQTGQYFVRRKSASSSPESQDDATARKLWQVSARLTGLSPS